MFEACLRRNDYISLKLVRNTFFNRRHSLSFLELQKFAVLENSGLEKKTNEEAYALFLRHQS